MTDLKNMLDSERSVLITTDSDSIPEASQQVLETLDGQSKFNCVYVSASRPHSTIEREMEALGIPLDRFFFVDLASSHSIDDQDNAVFVNPRSLTNLSIAIMTAVRSMPKDAPTIVLVDSIDTIMMYNKQQMVSRFAHSLVSRLRDQDATCMMLSSREGEYAAAIRGIGQFFDQNLHLDE